MVMFLTFLTFIVGGLLTWAVYDINDLEPSICAYISTTFMPLAIISESGVIGFAAMALWIFIAFIMPAIISRVEYEE